MTCGYKYVTRIRLLVHARLTRGLASLMSTLGKREACFSVDSSSSYSCVISECGEKSMLFFAISRPLPLPNHLATRPLSPLSLYI